MTPYSHFEMGVRMQAFALGGDRDAEFKLPIGVVCHRIFGSMGGALDRRLDGVTHFSKISLLIVLKRSNIFAETSAP